MWHWEAECRQQGGSDARLCAQTGLQPGALESICWQGDGEMIGPNARRPQQPSSGMRRRRRCAHVPTLDAAATCEAVTAGRFNTYLASILMHIIYSCLQALLAHSFPFSPLARSLARPHGALGVGGRLPPRQPRKHAVRAGQRLLQVQRNACGVGECRKNIQPPHKGCQP